MDVLKLLCLTSLGGVRDTYTNMGNNVVSVDTGEQSRKEQKSFHPIARRIVHLEDFYNHLCQQESF